MRKLVCNSSRLFFGGRVNGSNLVTTLSSLPFSSPFGPSSLSSRINAPTSLLSRNGKNNCQYYLNRPPSMCVSALFSTFDTSESRKMSNIGKNENTIKSNIANRDNCYCGETVINRIINNDNNASKCYRRSYQTYQENRFDSDLTFMNKAKFASHHKQHEHINSRSKKRMMSTDADNDDVYHAGLLHTEFSSELNVNKNSPVIPIFRVLGYDGNLIGNWMPPFSDEETIELYKFMVRLNVWDSMLYNVQRQGRISFYMQNIGEEAVQTGIGKALHPDDHIFCQYRELGVLLLHGFTIDDAINQLFSLKGDEGRGRQMPISYSKRAINLHTICTPLTTQVPHAAGAGYAFKLAGEKKCAAVFFGEGAASEGDFHAAMNFASVLKSQTIFVCRNNGYAISTPVKDQYAGDGIAIRGIAYGMETIRVDGNDLFASHIAYKQAREICVETSQPVCMEYMTYRLGHHSTSDDSTIYRPTHEIEAWTTHGINPIARVKKYLTNKNLWTDEHDDELRKEARTFLLQQMKKVEKGKKFSIVKGLFDYVYDKEPWHITIQRNSFEEHIRKHQDKYDISSYDGI